MTDPSILLVDEEPLMRRATALLLENRGGRVSAAASLAEAVLLADEQVFDVAILDIAATGPTAAAMLDALRTRGLLPRRFVVCWSGAPQEENDFVVTLRKPYSFDRLIAAVFGPGRGRERKTVRSGVFTPARASALVSLRPTRRTWRARPDWG